MLQIKPPSQILIFITVGIICAAIDITVMELLLISGAFPTLAVTCGFLAGLFANYLLHSRITFKSLPNFYSLLKYLVIVGVNYTITVLFVLASLKLLGNALTGKILSLPVIAVVGFLLSKYWAFK